jgi:hypothetical protein
MKLGIISSLQGFLRKKYLSPFPLGIGMNFQSNLCDLNYVRNNEKSTIDSIFLSTPNLRKVTANFCSLFARVQVSKVWFCLTLISGSISCAYPSGLFFVFSFYLVLKNFLSLKAD